MSNKVFDTLRFIQSLILPLAALISGLTEIFGFSWGVECAAALGVIDVFMGAFINEARKAYNKKQSE